MPTPEFTEQQIAIALCQNRHSVEVQCGVLSLRVRFEQDDIQDPPDYPYTHEQRHNFAHDLWGWWGLVLSVHVGERCVGDHAASLWQIDCVDPCMRDASHLAEIANGLVAEADVLKLLRHLRADVMHAVDDWLEAKAEAPNAMPAL
jgi:hypothetical protein